MRGGSNVSFDIRYTLTLEASMSALFLMLPSKYSDSPRSSDQVCMESEDSYSVAELNPTKFTATREIAAFGSSELIENGTLLLGGTVSIIVVPVIVSIG